jgi:hypothetical protein
MTRAERWLKVLGADGVLVDDGLGDVLVEGDLVRAALRLAEALPADVVRDRDQPVLGVPRALAAFEGAIGVHEGRLGDILGVRLVAQDDQRVAIHVAGVLSVELLEGPVRS